VSTIEGFTQKGHLMARSCSILAVLASLLLVPLADAQTPQQPRPHGQSYPAWAADWWTWALSQPVATNPVLDTTGEQCAVAQQGNVWFLAGTFSSGAVTRDCKVPAGTALLIPVINSFYCALAEDPPGQQTEEYVRSQVASVEGGAIGLSVTVDGRAVRRLTYEESEIFSIVLPADNVFGLPAGTLARPCADAGYYTLLPPLSVGEHTIEITGTGPEIAVDVTYELTVAPRSGKRP
jgi:hypothetical protein